MHYHFDLILNSLDSSSTLILTQFPNFGVLMATEEPTVALEPAPEPAEENPAEATANPKSGKAKKAKEPKARKAAAPRKPRAPPAHPPYEEVFHNSNFC